MITFACACGKNLKVAEEAVGKKVKCPGCAKVAAVPVKAAAAAASQETAALPDSDVHATVGSSPKHSATSAHGVTVAPAGSDSWQETHVNDHVAAAPLESAKQPRSLGGYRILRQLGQGGMGAVYEAEDTKLERRLALKVMKPEIARNPQHRERFLREARTAAKVESDFICPIYQVGEENGVPFIAMPFLKGEPLDARLKTGMPLAIDEVVRIGKEVAEGLSAAHESGLIHRDIKPANIWMETQRSGPPRARILDFGLARMQTEDVQITQSGAILGTPAYMSPEQARGDKTVDARTDLFSLGCVLYNLCAGELPFKGDTTMGMLMALAFHDPAPPHTIAPATPKPLSELILRLLAKNADDRPASARALIEELAEIEKNMPKPTHGIATKKIQQPTHTTGKSASTTAQISKAAGKSATRTQEMSPVAAPGKPPRKAAYVLFAVIALGLFVCGGGALSGVVFFWQTPDGVVRIESDDPSIKIAFDEGELKIIGAYKDALSLKPGKHGLKIKKGDDFEFETDKLIVSKGDKLVLKIEVLKGKVQIVQAGKGVLDSRDMPLPTTFSNSIGMEFVIVPKGKGWLGGGDGKPGDKEVEVAADFYLGKYEVTQEEWQKVTEAENKIADPDLKRLPVAGVSWDDAQLFLDKLNKRDKEAGWIYRLPTEAEWEYSCRGGPITDKQHGAFSYYFDKPTNQLLPAQANFGQGLGRPRKVGSYAPNALGLHDMHGNVWEWCQDTLGGGDRVSRGGGFINEADWCKPTGRVTRPASFRGGGNDHGLRVARVRGTIDASPVTSNDPDRKAAAYVLSIGGTVCLNGEERDIKDVGDLPKEAFRLTSVNLAGNKTVGDAELEIFRDCKNLMRLDLSCASISDTGLAHFQNCKKLVAIHVNVCRGVSDKSLSIFKDCHDLRELGLWYTGVSDLGLAELAGLKNLKELNLDNTKVGDQGLAHLKECPHVTHVGLHGTSVTDAGLVHLKHYKSLMHLNLNGTQVSNAGLAHLKDCKKLEHLNLNATKITGVGLPQLNGCKNLKDLHLREMKFTAANIEALQKALPTCQIAWDKPAD